MRLTAATVKALSIPAGKAEAFFWDDALPGFGVRLRGGGKKVYVVQYRAGQKQRRVTLGSLDVLALEEARQRARRTLLQVGDGADPQAEKLQARTNRHAEFLELANDYLARHGKKRLKPRSYQEVERHLLKHWKPLHRSAVAKIARADIAAGLAKLSGENGAVAADRARAALSACFTWAMREGLAETNPVSATNRPSEPQPRERVLDDAELKAIWSACRDDDYGRIVRLLALTGQRRDEIGSLRWSEVTSDPAQITLPPARTKNGRRHEVPLSAAAVELLAACPREADRDAVFGRSGHSAGFGGWSKAKAALDARIAKARDGKPLAPWRLHDLRRTAATRMADLGVQPHVIEAVLNHASGSKAGVAGIYNRSSYAAEKRAALELWASAVQRITK